MLSDRPYMREPEYRPNTLKPLYWLLGTIVGVFLLQNIVYKVSNQSIVLESWFSLYSDAVQQGFLWSFLTYGFLHGSFLHLLFNGLMLFFLGRILITLLGGQRFFTLFGVSVLMGGICWFIVNFWSPQNAYVVGASGGVMGLLVAFAMHVPNQPIHVLLFFVIPVKVTPINLVKILLIFDLVGLVLTEILKVNVGLQVAHSAHLGGMLGGWIFVKFILNQDFSIGRPDIKPPSWFTSKKTPKATTGRFRINFTNRNELQREVDRILDKINKEGFQSLTEAERTTLDKAKELLNR